MAVSESDLRNIPFVVVNKHYEHQLEVNIDILSFESDHVGFEGCDMKFVQDLERAILFSGSSVERLKTFFFINCKLPQSFIIFIQNFLTKNPIINLIICSEEYKLKFDAGTLNQSQLFNSYRLLFDLEFHDIKPGAGVDIDSNQFLVASSSEKLDSGTTSNSVAIPERRGSVSSIKQKRGCVIS